jgi:Fur family transcriptional regulator, stress-responsive regulator
VPEDPGDGPSLLRQRGLQVTAQRLAVLRAVSAASHATEPDIEVAVRADIGAVSRQAVYDALAALVGKGVLRRIQPSGSPGRYEARTGDNHHHLICRTCDRTVDVDCVVGYRPCLTPSESAGYEIDEAEVIFWGRCAECVSADANPAAPLNGKPRRPAQKTPSGSKRPPPPSKSR